MTDYSSGEKILESLGVVPLINAGGPVTRFLRDAPAARSHAGDDGDGRPVRRDA